MIKNNSNSTVAVKTLKRIERKAKWQLNTKTAAQGIVLQKQFLFISFFFFDSCFVHRALRLELYGVQRTSQLSRIFQPNVFSSR